MWLTKRPTSTPVAIKPTMPRPPLVPTNTTKASQSVALTDLFESQPPLKASSSLQFEGRLTDFRKKLVHPFRPHTNDPNGSFRNRHNRNDKKEDEKALLPDEADVTEPPTPNTEIDDETITNEEKKRLKRHEREANHGPEPYYGRRNFRNLALAGLGGMAFINSFGVIGDVLNWKDERAWTSEIPERSDQSLADKIGNGIGDGADFIKLPEALDVADHIGIPNTVSLLRFYQLMLQGQILWLSLQLGRAGLRKTIHPEGQYAEFHKMGFKGQNMKVGIISDGVMPTPSMPKEQIKRFELNQISEENPTGEVKLHDTDGKDTAMATMIAKAHPEAEFVVTVQRHRDVSNKINEALYNVIQDPDISHLQKTLVFYKPLIQSFADNLKRTVDEGADVVLLPNTLDSSNHIETMKTALSRYIFGHTPIGRLMGTDKPYKQNWLRHPFKNTKQFGKDTRAMIGFTNYLVSKLSRENITWAMEQGFEELLTPWNDALDYAYSKNVPVIIPAGDSGAHYDKRPDVIGNMNLLALSDHPALISVASGTSEKMATSQSVIKRRSSEWNERFQPDIAGNGHGEILSETRLSKDMTDAGVIFDRLRSPAKALRLRLELQNPVGGRPACSDVANVLLMMKQVAPDISIEEIKDIISNTADPMKPTYEAQDYLESLLSLHTRKLQEMDSANLSMLVRSLEQNFNDELKDPALAAYLSHALPKVFISPAQKPATGKPSTTSNNEQHIVFQSELYSEESPELMAELEKFTPEQWAKAKRALEKTLSNFQFMNSLLHDEISERGYRKNATGMINRKQAIEAAQELAKNKA